MKQELLDDDFLSERNNKALSLEDKKKINFLIIEANEMVQNIINGKTTIYVMIGLTFLATFVSLFSDSPYTKEEVLLESGIVIALYGGMAFMARKTAKIAFILTLAIYLLFIIASAVVEPGSLFTGLIIKIMILYFLTKGILAAFKLEKYIQQLKEFGLSANLANELKAGKKLERLDY